MVKRAIMVNLLRIVNPKIPRPRPHQIPLRLNEFRRQPGSANEATFITPTSPTPFSWAIGWRRRIPSRWEHFIVPRHQRQRRLGLRGYHAHRQRRSWKLPTPGPNPKARITVLLRESSRAEVGTSLI